MTGPETLELASQSIWLLVGISAPVMIVGLVVGVVIALIQALTQVQEMTLVFVPKIMAIFIALLIALPFMGAAMNTYTQMVFDLISNGT